MLLPTCIYLYILILDKELVNIYFVHSCTTYDGLGIGFSVIFSDTERRDVITSPYIFARLIRAS